MLVKQSKNDYQRGNILETIKQLLPKADRLRIKRSCEFPGSGFNITCNQKGAEINSRSKHKNFTRKAIK